MNNNQNLQIYNNNEQINQEINMKMYGYGNLQSFIPFNYTQNPLEMIGKANQCSIFQEYELSKDLSCCEVYNCYNVMIHDPILNQPIFLFKGKEETGCCTRKCCSNGIRPFRIKMKHIENMQSLMEKLSFDNYFFEMNKDCVCSCCCCGSEHITVSYSSNNTNFCSIEIPIRCERNFHCNIFDQNNTLKYTIFKENDCCFFYNKTEFDIFNGNDVNHNNKIGKMSKESFAYKFFEKDKRSLEITFPKDASTDDKMLIIMAGILIEYEWYGEKEQ